METQSHCTVSGRRNAPDLVYLGLLTLGVLAVHGYHPWAEDGGLYVAGVEYTLNPSLFPHERAFVTGHLHYSLFAPALAALVRISHLSLATVLLGTYLLTTAATLWAALRIARRWFAKPHAQWTAIALLAAWWTLPIAGTSLLLMDPYVTARSISMPLSLFAIGAALDPWFRSPALPPGQRRRSWLHPALTCSLALAVAAAFHPLMAAYALAFVIAVRLALKPRPAWVWLSVCACVLFGAALVQALAPPESPSVVAAAYSRYYWFLSQWHWFEWAGLLAPLAIFAALLRWAAQSTSPSLRAACTASIATGLLALTTALLFAQEHFRAHLIARLQPLRAFLLIYALMILLCGGALASWTQQISRANRSRTLRLSIPALPAICVAATALIMFYVQRASFPSSIHLELPGRNNPNPWVEAFVWAREHTPPDALFALDARYVNTPGEDAQTFRAISLRSAIPDFSKDGGEAAITPRLAPEWQRSATATQHLSDLSAAQTAQQLRPFGVNWLVLHADAQTDKPCPYRNSVVKVCRSTETQ